MSLDPTQDFLGSGWKFPPQLDERGRMALSHQAEDVAEAIRLILLTRKGERPMRPEFGSQLHELHFQPVDAATCGMARRFITEALARWEPRIDQVEVTAVPDARFPERLYIDISYRLIATNDIRNLVFPFYTIPGED